MKNKEKYSDEIIDAFRSKGICKFRKKHNLHVEPDRHINCSLNSCDDCDEKTAKWMEQEVNEVERNNINWSEISVDTPLVVWNTDPTYSCVRHFSYYDKKSDMIYCWENGRTSFTATLDCPWENGRLYTKEDEKILN